MLAQKADILLVKADILLLKKHIIKFKNDIIKWMFIFWIGQVVATFGFILLFPEEIISFPAINVISSGEFKKY